MQKVQIKNKNIAQDLTEKKRMGVSVFSKGRQTQYASHEKTRIKHPFQIFQQTDKINRSHIFPGNFGEIVVHVPSRQYILHFSELNLHLGVVAENTFGQRRLQHGNDGAETVEPAETVRKNLAEQTGAQTRHNEKNQ